MAESSINSVDTNGVKNITAKMKSATIKAGRGAISSAKNLTAGEDSWSFSLIGKLVTKKGNIETTDIKEELNNLWKNYKKRETVIVGKYLIVFKFHPEKDKNDVLKKSPWNVQRCLLALQDYTTGVAYTYYVFRKQQWSVQFKGLLLEHHHVAVIDEAIADLGKKISTDPPNCRPRSDNMITARIEIDLTQPLKRGDWWNSNHGEPVWIRYHWLKQPHSLCDRCYIIDHDDEICVEVAELLKERAMTVEEYEEHRKNKEKTRKAT